MIEQRLEPHRKIANWTRSPRNKTLSEMPEQKERALISLPLSGT
jgi:hypothetical protein